MPAIQLVWVPQIELFAIFMVFGFSQLEDIPKPV
jgi:hypothetical protein